MFVHRPSHWKFAQFQPEFWNAQRDVFQVEKFPHLQQAPAFGPSDVTG